MKNKEQDNKSDTEPSVIAANIEELPKNAEMFMLVCRGFGTWTPTQFHRNKIDAEADKLTWSTYDEYKIIRVVLPV